MEDFLYPHFYEIENEHWWFAARQRIVWEFIRKQLMTPPGARILDVGCGTGAILDMLSKKFDVYGQDVSEQAVAFCRQRGLKKVFCGPIDQVVPRDRPFDLVTTLDVIEHIDDDIGTLRQIHALLRTDGKVLIAVPAFPSLWGPHDVMTHHKRRYVKSTLRSSVEAAGFEVEYMTYFNCFLLPVALVRRIAAKLAGGERGSDLDMPSRPINAALRALFESEKWFLPAVKFPFGLSLLCVGRKLSVAP
jgi:SAM-dependent methyltransferase